MVKVKSVRTRADCFRAGIHLSRPTERQVSDAKEDASAKGFPTVWVDKRGVCE